jgi:hypothetical protein
MKGQGDNAQMPATLTNDVIEVGLDVLESKVRQWSRSKKGKTAKERSTRGAEEMLYKVDVSVTVNIDSMNVPVTL